jgi:3-hydroxypropanoate dehydrogenase
MTSAISPEALAQLFISARSYNEWSNVPLDTSIIRNIYDVMKWGPTSGNCNPARFVWVHSPEAKVQLAECAADLNRAKVLAAPLTVIIGYDLAFADAMPKLFPARGEMMRQYFQKPGIGEITAIRNSTLQGAYLMLAARALGLDCGPMSGFDHAGVDEAFFAGTQIRSNFLCAIGVGKRNAVFPRNPRFTFEEAGRIA